MSIRQGLLALLEERPRYGYELRQEFESRTGSTWPLNVGQVYTTLSRLERDGFVEPDHTDEEGHAYYRITPSGTAEVARWFASPVSRESQPRDELAIKLALAITLPGVDVRGMVQTQRAETMRSLQEVTRLKGQSDEADLAWTLVADAMVFQAEAEIRWLDHCEARLVRAAAARSGSPLPQPGAAPVPAEVAR